MFNKKLKARVKHLEDRLRYIENKEKYKDLLEEANSAGVRAWLSASGNLSVYTDSSCRWMTEASVLTLKGMIHEAKCSKRNRKTIKKGAR